MDLARFYVLRERLFNLIRKEDNGYHKSYEGAIDVIYFYPNIFESTGNPEKADSVKIELHCYLLCSNRHEEFTGGTFSDCLDKFEAWIKLLEPVIDNDDDF